ncbi:MAG TPA: NADH-quinone oxidoreductase subunit C [Bacillota bacterium]|nr:NADH-quinone oxidoreductase subunit C [Bacillota bacterium]
MSFAEQQQSDLSRKDILADLCAQFPDEVSGAVSTRPGRAWAEVSKEALHRVVEFLLGCDDKAYLSTITAVDAQEEFQVLYHFWAGGTEVTLRVKLDHNNPVVPTIMDLAPGANFYEREIHDLMGIEVTGRGELKRLIVTDDWPEGNHPLRKDWKGLPGGEDDG